MKTSYLAFASMAIAALAAFGPVRAVEAASAQSRHEVSLRHFVSRRDETTNPNGHDAPQGTHYIYLPFATGGSGGSGGGGGIVFAMTDPTEEKICDYPAVWLVGYGVKAEALETARSCGDHVIVILVAQYTDVLQDDGTGFSFSKFRNILQDYVGVIDAYVTDGTIIAHLVVDEPHDCDKWGGACLTTANVEEAARISKEYWPALRTMVNTLPSFAEGYRWQDIDIVNFLYAYHKGPLDVFVQDSVAVLDGGYVADIYWQVQAISGGCEDWDECPMTEAQVQEVGEAMCDTGKGSYISFSRYDEVLLDGPMVQTIEELSTYCGGS